MSVLPAMAHGRGIHGSSSSLRSARYKSYIQVTGIQTSTVCHAIQDLLTESGLASLILEDAFN
jgi:hypothetical protein